MFTRSEAVYKIDGRLIAQVENIEVKQYHIDIQINTMILSQHPLIGLAWRLILKFIYFSLSILQINLGIFFAGGMSMPGAKMMGRRVGSLI